MTDQTPPPFDESRRLTGHNLYFTGTGAALEGVGVPTADALARWRANIAAARAALQWPDGPVVAREHATGVSLAFAAPLDQLYAAAATNEWAWCDALGVANPDEESPLLGISGRDASLAALRELAVAEAKPALIALMAAASGRGVPAFADDDALSLGAGQGSRTWPLDALPAVDAVDFDALHDVPTALVTGSNGKTTTTRILAAMLRAQGWPPAWSSTEGVYVDGVLVDGGDYSGPGGARLALRQHAAGSAVLETARGGLLRRGLASTRADAAVVTNISPDHFGEYGIHDLDALAEVKLVVARAVANEGLLVLNADDARLRRLGEGRAARIGWFAADYDDPFLQEHRARGGASAGVRDGRLWLADAGGEHDLGAVADMPLTLGGSAVHNIANLSAAALAALALGVDAATMATVAARFGSAPGDNPGRLQPWRFGNTVLLVDYAHNEDGIGHSLRALHAQVEPCARFGLVLGHAGNREDGDYHKVAGVVAGFDPARVILKETDGYERGRAPGEVPRLLGDALIAHGVDASRMQVVPDETEAATVLLGWAEPGDALFLQMLTPQGRDRIGVRLARLQAEGWQPGRPLPDFHDEPNPDESE